MRKCVVKGALVGVIIGLILEFIYPEILRFELFYNIEQRNLSGIPQSLQYKSGSIYSVGFIFPALAGLMGGLLGFTLYKFKN